MYISYRARAKCGEMVSMGDLSVRQLRTNFWWSHYAYVCNKCDPIIGFGSNALW